MTPAFEAIADGLAQSSLAISDQFLSQTEVNAIVQGNHFRSSAERFKKAGIGKQNTLQINEGIRGDYIQWLDKVSAAPELCVYLERIDALLQFLNRTLFLSLKDYEIHLTIYPVGSFYRRHLDQFKKDDHRKLSVICYLNPEWRENEGGQLRIFRDGSSLDIFPEAGRLVCFRSDQLEHEVLPATRERLSLTGWMLDQFAGLKHL